MSSRFPTDEALEKEDRIDETCLSEYGTWPIAHPLKTSVSIDPPNFLAPVILIFKYFLSMTCWPHWNLKENWIFYSFSTQISEQCESHEAASRYCQLSVIWEPLLSYWQLLPLEPSCPVSQQDDDKTEQVQGQRGKFYDSECWVVGGRAGGEEGRWCWQLWSLEPSCPVCQQDDDITEQVQSQRGKFYDSKCWVVGVRGLLTVTVSEPSCPVCHQDDSKTEQVQGQRGKFYESECWVWWGEGGASTVTVSGTVMYSLSPRWQQNWTSSRSKR